MDDVLVAVVINAVVLVVVGGMMFASGFDAMYILISFNRFAWKSNCASAKTHETSRQCLEEAERITKHIANAYQHMC